MTGRLFTGQQRQGGSTVCDAACPERSRRVLSNPMRCADPTGTCVPEVTCGGLWQADSAHLTPMGYGLAPFPRAGVPMVLLALMVSACDDPEGIAFVNSTDSPVSVTFSVDDGARHPVVLQPYESVRSKGVLFWKGCTLPVDAVQNSVPVFDRVLAYDELKALDFRIEIAEGAGTSPTPTTPPQTWRVRDPEGVIP